MTKIADSIVRRVFKLSNGVRIFIRMSALSGQNLLASMVCEVVWNRMDFVEPHLLNTLGLTGNYVDQPEGFTTNSRPYAYRRYTRIEADCFNQAAVDLYDRLTASVVVQQHIDQQTSVLGDGKDRGMIKPFRSKVKAKDIKTMMMLLYNLSQLASYPTMKLEEGYRDHTYQRVPLNNAVVNRDRLSSIIYALMVLDGGWLHGIAGRYNRQTGKGLDTRIEPLTPMLNFLIQHGLVAFRPKKTPEKADLTAPVLRLSLIGKQTKTEVLSRPLSDVEVVLPLLNAELAKQNISMHWPDYATYKSYWSYKRHRLQISPYGKQVLYRQFQQADGCGGRLYGHFVQRLPGKLRHHLRINRMAVVEAEYNAYHLRILAALQDFALPRSDLYKNPYEDRTLFKMMLTTSTGCGTRKKTTASIRNSLRLANKTDLVKAEELYDAFWSTYPDLCPHRDDGTDAIWLRTHLINSEIALHVLRLLYDDGIYAIPIHDSFIVQDRYRDQLKAAMMTAWSARFPNAAMMVTETGKICKL